MFPNLSFLPISGDAEEAKAMSDAELCEQLKRCKVLRREEKRRVERKEAQEAMEAARQGSPPAAAAADPDPDPDPGASEGDGGGPSSLQPPPPPKKAKTDGYFSTAPTRVRRDNYFSAALRSKWGEITDKKMWPPNEEAMAELYAPFYNMGFNKEDWGIWPDPPRELETVISTIIFGRVPMIDSLTEKGCGDGFHVEGGNDVPFFEEGGLPPRGLVKEWDSDTWVENLKRWFLIRVLYEEAAAGSAGATR